MSKIEQPTDVFKQKMQEYKQLIDADIAEYTKRLQESTLRQYGQPARVEVEAFLDLLGRGGKRIRGALTMVAYEMCGGTDRAMILQAARAMEMLNAYLLIIDDIQDRSTVRRGGPTVHVRLADHHRQQNFTGDADHFGLSIALDAALAGAHGSIDVLSGLDVSAELRLKALGLTNRTLAETVHGQTADIFSEVMPGVSQQQVNSMMQWKTAGYTVVNPLQVGMVLAGAGEQPLEAIKPYALNTGTAFQITDDIIGTFGTELKVGKSPMDDIREGKRTLLVLHALEKAGPADREFLLQMLGNKDLTPDQFERCKDIFVSSGALDYAKAQADEHIEQAISSLDNANQQWSAEGVAFLKGLASYILTRTA